MSPSEQEAVAAVLTEIQAGTEAQIELVVDADPDLDVDAAVLDQWAELDLDDVGLLIFVATGRREIRVMAGPRLMADVEETFWQEVADAVAAGFRTGDPAGGVRTALQPVAPLLRRVAPAGPPA